ncbi:MAG: ATP-binding protein [Paludibacteraceae bacterium]|nr:ATP-binding protein [Paludibacteraceae bacterium]
MSKFTPRNPFIISGYESPEYFCDREKETKDLHSALYNERNVVLLSARRMGKTGLIRHLFATIDPQEAYCIYVDIYRTECLKDFIEHMGRAIIGQCGSPSARERVMQVLQSLRFSFATDPITGQPEIGVSMVNPQEETISLAQIFSYMEHADKPVYVAIDEFQRILDYPEDNMEEILRTYIQHLRNVFFIFSGSQKHMMIEMFSSVERAFYQSAQMMYLESIPEEAYYAFCSHHFEAHHQHMATETFHFLYTVLSAHTWYIQAVLNRLYAMDVEQITIEIVQQCISNLIEENQFTYQNYCALLVTNQLRVLQAIAKERIVKEPNKQEFLNKYALSAGSTVRAAIKVLMEKEFIQKSAEGYSVYDRFFGIWLA